MQIDLARFHDSFFQDAAEHLAHMEANLLRLEEQSADQELLNDIFRSAHSIKGASATFGFEDLARFTHSLETLLDRVREGAVAVDTGMANLLLGSVDVLKDLLASARSGTPPPPGAEELAGRLAAVAGGGTAPPAASPTPAAPASETVYRIRFQPCADLFRQGMDPVLILRELGSHGRILDLRPDLTRLPPLAGLDASACYLAWDIRLSSVSSPDEIRNVFAFVEDGSVIAVEAEAAGVEKSAATAPQASRPTEAAAPRDASSIRVSTGKVDHLIDLVGELVIAESMAAQILANFSETDLPPLQAAFSEMQRFTRELQERVMGVRMLPIATVFSRFPRMVRDLAQITGKRLVLEMSGEETELDKTVVDGLADPLTHLIRNAADHGIETPEARRAAGKPEQGVIRLDAFHEGGNVVVQVSDDGGGLDPDRIRAKAVERGLIASDAALSGSEIQALVFEPGFSTAGEVTGLSGRGVGMDVVRRHVEALNGAVSIASEPGRGATVRIKLPLTLAILDGLLVQVGAETYILPLVSIVESIRPRPEQLHVLPGRGEVVAVRGESLPIARLHSLFEVPNAIHDPAAGLLVLVEHQGRQLALLVDDLTGQQQVVIKSLETNFRKVDGVTGGTILGDGRVALILDVAGLVQMARILPAVA